MMTDPDQVASALSEAVSIGDWRLLFWERDQAKKVTVQDLQRAAAKYLIPANLTVGEFIPDSVPVRAAIPATPDYAAVLNGYTGDKAVSTGEAFDPSPSNIEAHTTKAAVGAIKLAILPKKTRGNLINSSLQIHFGSEQALRNRAIAGEFTSALLMRGTRKHDMTALQDALTAAKDWRLLPEGQVVFRTSR